MNRDTVAGAPGGFGGRVCRARPGRVGGGAHERRGRKRGRSGAREGAYGKRVRLGGGLPGASRRRAQARVRFGAFRGRGGRPHETGSRRRRPCG
ncbi:hypothetical protein CP974_06290 [Streptomyces fradiae ATCC 10745 = DSM 40063]|nr:hypothetical protein CP974_06290 [Streptomyces fradiae ATCC 10745 = DSM 40063]